MENFKHSEFKVFGARIYAFFWKKVEENFLTLLVEPCLNVPQHLIQLNHSVMYQQHTFSHTRVAWLLLT